MPRCVGSLPRGKEGFPTLAFQIIVNHRRRILHTTGAFLGTTNDKSIARLDPAFTELHEGRGCARNFKFKMFDSRGQVVEHKGAYLLVDGKIMRIICNERKKIENNKSMPPSGSISASMASSRLKPNTTQNVLKSRMQA
jgi:hypothetical protein